MREFVHWTSVANRKGSCRQMKFRTTRNAAGLALIWVFLVTCTPWRRVAAQAGVDGSSSSSAYSSNPDDYSFGWITNSIKAPGTLPVCQYCINAIGDPTLPPAEGGNITEGFNWNRTVGLYRCDGVQINEGWALHNATNTIVFHNLTQLLCVDARNWNSSDASPPLRMYLLPCDPSLQSQKWFLEDNRLRSGLPGPLFVATRTPDPALDPTSTIYDYAVRVQALDESKQNEFHFSFLEFSTLVDRVGREVGLIHIADASGGSNLLSNSGFEDSTIQPGATFANSDWVQRQPSYFSLCSWVIDTGPIMYVTTGVMSAAEGRRSVHLNSEAKSNSSGSVSQTFRTVPGAGYNLSFSARAFPKRISIANCPDDYSAALLRVSVADVGALGEIVMRNASDFRFDNLNASGDPLWQDEFVVFTAAVSQTRVSFESLNVNKPCGPMIDNVRVTRPPVRKGRGWLTGVVAALVVVSVIGAAVAAICIRRHRYCCTTQPDFSHLKSDHARPFTWKELHVATQGFKTVVGEGGFGTVYRADFPDGTVGAVKVEKESTSGKNLVSEEIHVLLRVHHRNLVNLIGFCLHKGRHVLVFEFLPGNLFDRLHYLVPTRALVKNMSPFNDSQNLLGGLQQQQSAISTAEQVLSWEARMKILSDIACGLEYLHHDAEPPIVHRDIKSQNILLTSTDASKLADFGLSKTESTTATAFQSVETMVRGSLGYLDPQYVQTGVFSSKSDVYSFGVLILELISGNKAIHDMAPLTSWARPHMKTDVSEYQKLLDPLLQGKHEPQQLVSVVELILMCLQEEPKQRPSMRQIVVFLMSRGLMTDGGESNASWTREELVEKYQKPSANARKFMELSQSSFSGTSSGSFNHMWSTPLAPEPRD